MYAYIQVKRLQNGPSKKSYVHEILLVGLPSDDSGRKRTGKGVTAIGKGGEEMERERQGEGEGRTVAS